MWFHLPWVLKDVLNDFRMFSFFESCVLGNHKFISPNGSTVRSLYMLVFWSPTTINRKQECLFVLSILWLSTKYGKSINQCISCRNWDGFKDNYTAMMFSGGDRCWNGPDRSLRVKLLFPPYPRPVIIFNRELLSFSKKLRFCTLFGCITKLISNSYRVSNAT